MRMALPAETVTLELLNRLASTSESSLRLPFLSLMILTQLPLLLARREVLVAQNNGPLLTPLRVALQCGWVEAVHQILFVSEPEVREAGSGSVVTRCEQ